MAYDRQLAERVREFLDDQPELDEKNMFGGIAFMVRGNMAVGISGDGLMARVGTDDYEAALSRPGVDVFGKTGSPMRGWVLVTAGVIEDENGLSEWINRGLSVALALPPK